MRLLSLFSGCGGMDIGFEGGFTCLSKSINKNMHADWIEKEDETWTLLKKTGFETVFANDIRPDAKAAWVSYFSTRKKNANDIYHLTSKQDNISDTTKYEDHFVAENRLIAISKSGRSMDSEDVQNFLNATERGIDVQLFVRKNKDDKISKEFYYLGRVIATGNAKQFVMPNTDKTAVEIEWELETPVREDIYQYIVNE